MQFKEGAKLYSYETQREGGEDILYVNYLGAPFVPNIAEYPNVMESTVDYLIENPNVSRIIFVQQKNYSYDSVETFYLLEIAQIYVYLIRQEEILSQKKLGSDSLFNKRYNELFSFLLLLKQDPIKASIYLKRIIIENKILLGKLDYVPKTIQMNYLSLLDRILLMTSSLP